MSFFKKLFGRQNTQEEKSSISEIEKVEKEAIDSVVEEIPQQEEKAEEASLEEEILVEETVEPVVDEKEEIAEQAVEEAIEQMEEAAHQAHEALVEIAEDTLEVLDPLGEDSSCEVQEEVLEQMAQAVEETVEDALETIVEETVDAVEEIVEVEETPKKQGMFSKLFKGLTKTRDNILHSVEDVLKGFKKIDEDLYEELEEVLIMADFGVETSLAIMEQLRETVKERKIVDPEQLTATLQEIITQILTSQTVSPILVEDRPNVILVIGVNGAGKTTTIGKLSNQLQKEGKKVVVAAADTFRAAAIEQLQVWADRASVDLIKHEEGSDPASVVYDGIHAAKARKADVLLCDTAGRLQNKTNLMKELEKISRIIEREYPEAHKEVLIVLDATTGQNAISQVKIFKEAAKVNGIILTKLDGTAKGGAVVGICQSMGVPVKYIGVGEKIEDLQVFDPALFAEALFAKQS